MLTVFSQCTSKWKSVQTSGSNSVLLLNSLTAEQVPSIEIHRRLQAIYGDQCVDVSTVRRWVRRFKDGELGQADLNDKTQSGRPVTASDQLHQDRFEELIRGNRRIKQTFLSVI